MSGEKISKSGRLNGNITIPGDKSISHRAAMLLAVSEGVGEIRNFATGDDCSATLVCLAELGVPVERDRTTVRITGRGKLGLQRPGKPLDCGNSGTTMRLLAGLLAGQPFQSRLIGDESLSKRPMGRIAEPLNRMGAGVNLDDDHAPVEIRGRRPLKTIDYSLPVASAQVKSCVLIAGLYSERGVRVMSPEIDFQGPASRDHTERMLQYLGADIEESYIENGGRFRRVLTINPGSVLRARDLEVPGDISTAAFFLVAASGLKGSDVTLKDVGLNPTRTAIVDIMDQCGIRISVSNKTESCNEARGDLRVDWEGECQLVNEAIQISGSRIAGLIDEIPVLAVLGTLLPGGLEVRGAEELRSKESDRIHAIVTNLRRMGAEIDEFDDGFHVAKSKLSPAVLESFDDHRIAMAFSVAAMFAEGESIIKGSDCVSVSYPGFFEKLAELTWK